jgi:hypothetical protein
MQLAALFDVLADPTVTSVSVQIHTESVGELHAELLQLYLYCLSRLVGALDLARVRAEDAKTVGQYFAKFGVPPRRRAARAGDGPRAVRRVGQRARAAALAAVQPPAAAARRVRRVRSTARRLASRPSR